MMPQISDHYRLAVTHFDDREPLWKSVVAIIEAGLRFEQLCLIALASAVARFAPFAFAVGDQLERSVIVFNEMHEWTCPMDGQGVVTTSEPICKLVLSTSIESSSDRRAPSSPQFDILNQVRQGYIALIVASCDPKQQLMVTRTLLAISSHQVTTYEFRAPEQRERP